MQIMGAVILVKGQQVSSLDKPGQCRYAYIDCAAVQYAGVG